MYLDERIKYRYSLFDDLKLSKDEIDKNFYELNGETLKTYSEKKSLSSEMDVLNYIRYVSKYDDDISKYIKLLRETQISKWGQFYKPVFAHYWDCLIAILENHKDILCDADRTKYEVISFITKQLNAIAYRTLILETNIARERGILKGETSEERGRYFFHTLLASPDYLMEIYENYPELLRLMDLRMKYSLVFIETIFSDTKNNLEKIQNSLNDGKPLGKIASIEFSAGDTHNKGKSVSKLLFHYNDEEKIIVYKPRNLVIDAQFNRFLEWVNKSDIGVNVGQFKTVKLCSSEHSGWMEYIINAPCQEEQQLQDYYVKTGALLCLLYTLSASDLHCENLIACGDSPVIIDSETIIQPKRLCKLESDRSSKVMDIITQSVKSLAILPTYIYNRKEDRVMEVGGLGGNQGQYSAYKSNYIDGAKSDCIKIEKRFARMDMEKNNPMIGKKVINAADYLQDIQKGFMDTYYWILLHKDEYMNMLKETFKDTENRVLYRATRVYYNLLDVSYHPDLLSDKEDRYVYMHRLMMGRVGNEVGKQEIDSLMDGDIPLFCTNSSLLNEEQKEIFEYSAIENAINKINQMSELDLARQNTIIGICFQQYPKFETNIKNHVAIKPTGVETLYREVCEEIADKVMERAISFTKDGKENWTWLGSTVDEMGIVDIQDLGNGFYDGRSGIAFFFLCLMQCVKETKYQEVGLRIADEIAIDIEQAESFGKNYGVYTGLGGCLFLLAYADNLGVRDYDVAIKKLLNEFEANIEEMSQYDVINGCAGLLSLIAYIYETSKKEDFRTMAFNISKKIVKRIKDSKTLLNDSMVTWGEPGYVGFAHGNAGISAQLARVNVYLCDKEVDELIGQSVVFENDAFDETHQNWPRTSEKNNYMGHGWCHGAPGILLNRIMLKKYGYSNDVIERDIKNAIEICKNKSLGLDYCLCHGDAGNLLILKEAALELKDDALSQYCDAMLYSLIHNFYQKESKYLGCLNMHENSEIMCGLTGLGYVLLKFQNFSDIPNVLNMREGCDE